MDWVTVAILGTITIGVVNVIDSHLITRRMPSLRAYLLLVAVVILFFCVVLFVLFPLPEGVGTWPLVVTVASAVIRTASIIILLYIFKTEEVSLAIPVFHTFPVFVALMAVPLLGETLGSLQWLAIISVVAGAVIISFKRNSGGATTWLGKPFFLLLGASLLMAAADVGSKYALSYISFWNMYWISSLCLVGIFLLISLRPHIIREIRNMPWQRPAMALVAVNETLAVIGIILVFWAMAMGPVSLVSAINGSRPLVVFISAIVIGRVSPGLLLEGKPDGGVMALRLAAIAMIVGGIAIIYLT